MISMLEAESAGSTAAGASPRETVVLIHGFGGNRWVMQPLERRLQRCGYETLNWSYRSWRGDLTAYARQLYVDLCQRDFLSRRIHLVGHSMGSIVLRVLLSEYPWVVDRSGGSFNSSDLPGQNRAIPERQEGADPLRLGRIVQVAPPNRGTPVARVAGPLLAPLCRSVLQLSDAPHSFVNQLGQLPVAPGIIRAKYDLLIPPESARIPGLGAEVMLPGSHGSLLFRQELADQIHAYLATGQFLPVAAT